MDATLDVETKNIQSLVDDLKSLRSKWSSILSEAKLVAMAYGLDPDFPEADVRVRKVRTFHGETNSETTWKSQEEKFKVEVFYRIIDNLIVSLSTRFAALSEIESKFSFLWKYAEMDEQSLEEDCARFSEKYSCDVSMDLADEMKYLKNISKANISEDVLKPISLLNKLLSLGVTNMFPNVCVALRIFCSLPVSVAHAERSFSVLCRIKNYLRSTMGQQRLTDLGILSIESKLARTVNFDPIIQTFAERKSRKIAI